MDDDLSFHLYDRVNSAERVSSSFPSLVVLLVDVVAGIPTSTFLSNIHHGLRSHENFCRPKAPDDFQHIADLL